MKDESGSSEKFFSGGLRGQLGCVVGLSHQGGTASRRTSGVHHDADDAPVRYHPFWQ
jgi:hypothetical protein